MRANANGMLRSIVSPNSAASMIWRCRRGASTFHRAAFLSALNLPLIRVASFALLPSFFVQKILDPAPFAFICHRLEQFKVMIDVLTPDTTVHARPSDPVSRLRSINAASSIRALNNNMWHPINSLADIPTGRELRLAVLDGDKVHALVFACRRDGDRWIDASTGRMIEVHPTHWQEWDSAKPDRASRDGQSI
jgi:hypothetical protein